MQIELLHPITHGVGKVVKTFSRGLHDLDDGLAKEFLKLKDTATGQPIARIPEEKQGPEKGTVVVESTNEKAKAEADAKAKAEAEAKAKAEAAKKK